MGQRVLGPYTQGDWDGSYLVSYQDHTIRIWIPPSLLQNDSDYFRIAFGYYSTSFQYYDEVWVGQSSGATANYVFDGDPVQVTFDDGSETVS